MECLRLSRLIDDLLLLAQSDKDEWSATFSPASPKTILINTFERFEGLARDKHITLLLERPKQSVPNISCDLQRIEQILAILVDNALSYTPSGGTIRLSLHEKRQAVHFWVEDTGPGIPDTEKKLVFDRFYRSDKSRKDKQHFGLGLSVAKELADLHQGSIAVKDSPLGGALLILSLPCHKSL